MRKFKRDWFRIKKYRSQYCVYRKLDIHDDILLEFTFFYSTHISDKVQNVRIDLDGKKVYVTSSELSADELLECIKKTGKTTNYIGLAANWRSRQNTSVHPFCLPAHLRQPCVLDQLPLWFNEMISFILTSIFKVFKLYVN